MRAIFVCSPAAALLTTATPQVHKLDATELPSRRPAQPAARVAGGVHTCAVASAALQDRHPLPASLVAIRASPAALWHDTAALAHSVTVARISGGLLHGAERGVRLHGGALACLLTKSRGC